MKVLLLAGVANATCIAPTAWYKARCEECDKVYEDPTGQEEPTCLTFLHTKCYDSHEACCDAESGITVDPESCVEGVATTENWAPNSWWEAECVECPEVQNGACVTFENTYVYATYEQCCSDIHATCGGDPGEVSEEESVVETEESVVVETEEEESVVVETESVVETVVESEESGGKPVIPGAPPPGLLPPPADIKDEIEHIPDPRDHIGKVKGLADKFKNKGNGGDDDGCDVELLRVAYWGQNSVHYAGGDEATLEDSCLYHDVVIVSFILPAADEAKPYTINHAKHGGFDATTGQNTNMDVIGEMVRHCREDLGVIVLVSIGGATAVYDSWGSMDTEAQAELFFTEFVYPGTASPYGQRFDGIDLNVESTSHLYPVSNWLIWAEKYRELANAAYESDGVYGYLTTAPQAPETPEYNPTVDAHIGWATLSTPGLFDHLYIQYYNNPGSPAQPGDWSFEASTESWCGLGLDTGAFTMIGLPALAEGAGAGDGSGYYVPSSEMGDHFAVIHTHECNMGGFMVWDSGMDIMNVEQGKIYTERLVEEWMDEACPHRR